MIVSVIEEIFHLGSRPLDTECLGIFIALALQNLLRQCFWDVAMEGLWYHGELTQLGEWLQRRNDRDGDAHLASLLYESIEFLVVVEELGDGIVSAQLLLLQKMLYVHLEIRSLFVLLRIAGYATAEFLTRMLDRGAVEEETVIKLVYLLQQVGGVGMTVFCWSKLSVFLRLVASQHKDIADAQKLEIEQFVFDVFLRGTATDDVRDDRDVVLVLDCACDGNGTRAATHTLTSEETIFQFLVNILAVVCGNVDKPWVEVLEAVDGAEESRSAITLERWQNLEREASFVALLM